MSTKRVFQDMLNEYLPNELLKEELIQRDYILQNMQKDNNWKGGKLIVPFKGAGASSVKMGGLTDSADIAQSKYVRGSIDDYREVWGSLIFNQRDLQEHDGRIPDSTFLKLLPDELEDFMDYKKEVVSIQLGTGPHFGTVTVDGTAGGVIGIDKIDRVQIGQKVILETAASIAPPITAVAPAEYYVTAINVDDSTMVLSDSRGGAPDATVANYLATEFAKFYHDGVTDGTGSFDTFVSMRMALLSFANGGSQKIHGVNKLAYPMLQAVNIDGSAIAAATIVTDLFDAYTTVRQKTKGRATEYLMSLKNYGSVMKAIEADKGSFRVVEAPKESLFGWMEMTIANVTGQVIKFVGIQEMDDDIIPMVDWRSITFRSNGYFKKRVSPEGQEYYETRSESGYQYIVDCCLFGEAEYKKPGHSAIIYGISYA